MIFLPNEIYHKITLQKTNIDYLIVGQGLAGSWLGYKLLQRGHSVMIFNKEKKETASLKAAGLYNPITGRKMVKTWLADELFSDLESNYQTLEKLTQTSFIHPKSIYRPFKSAEDANDWEGKIANEHFSDYVQEIILKPIYEESISNDFGGILLKKSGYVDLPSFIPAMRKYFSEQNSYVNEAFDYGAVNIEENTIQYKQWICKKVVFCEGSLSKNPYWENLKFRPVRGDVITIESEMHTDKILNQGVFMIPKNNHFVVGSTYDHTNLCFEPQEDGILELKRRLANFYRGKCTVIDARAGVRPATYDRKPFIGFHQKHKNIAIFNGLGAKGVSLAPFFADHLADVLEEKTKLRKEVDVQRNF